jgi:FdhD protein
MMDTVGKRIVRRHVGEAVEHFEDSLALEQKIRIAINGRDALSVYATPAMVRELVVGLVMTEGIIQGAWCADRIGIEYGEEILVNIPAEGEVVLEGRTITSGCVGGVTFDRKRRSGPIIDPLVVTRRQLRDVYRDFQSRSELYRLTGCIHSAALSDGKTILCVAEDIGRHNAVDKVIGYAILETIPFSGTILMASGRISSEIASKCARWGIPMLVTRTAPTHLAVRIAEESGVTVVGFMRGDRFTVYAHPERVVP